MVYHRFIENLRAIYCTGIIMPRTGWKSVALPEGLYNEVTKVIARVTRWNNVAEFVRDAVRRLLEEVEKCEG